MKKTNEVTNAELQKAKIETEKELSESQAINAYLSNHAVEHYCAATGREQSEVEGIISATTKEAGVNWLYTQPAIDGTRADGTALPSAAEWEAQNEGAVRVDKLAGKQWYKRPFTIGDARGVRSIVAGYNNYLDAKAGAQKKVDNTLAAAAAILGITVEQLKALKG